jgi:hypothetical protein
MPRYFLSPRASRANKSAPALAALVTLAALGLGACGGSDPPPPEDPASVELPPAGGEGSKTAGAGTSAASAPTSAPEASAKPAEPPPEPAAKGGEAPGSPATLPAPEPRKPPAPPVAAPAEFEGTLSARKGSVLIINTTGGAPPTGAKGALFRFFEQKIGPFNTSGWLGIADVTVKDVDAGKVQLSLDAEKSIMHVNGKKVDHFTAGTRVKLELTK